MTHLICKVQRLFLNDDRHTCIREGETFEVAEPTATEYVTGGIARHVTEPVKAPVPVKAEEPASEPVQAAQEIEKPAEVPGKKRR